MVALWVALAARCSSLWPTITTTRKCCALAYPIKLLNRAHKTNSIKSVASVPMKLPTRFVHWPARKQKRRAATKPCSLHCNQSKTFINIKYNYLMKQRILSGTLALLLTSSAFAQTPDIPNTNKQGSKYQFTVVKDNATSSVKNQFHSGTCWCFSTQSFLESELMRMGKGNIPL